jgi:hypothetical protein
MKIELDSNKENMTISLQWDVDGLLEIGLHHYSNYAEDWYLSVKIEDLEKAIKFLKEDGRI